MKIYTIILLFAFLALAACKNDKPQRPPSLLEDKATDSDIMENPVKRERIEEMRKKSKSVDIPGYRKQAASILAFRAKKDTNTYAIIEADVWEYQFVFDGEMSKPGAYDGVWIDFKDDGTYEYGKYDKVQGSGLYNYQFDRSELLMLDNDNSLKPQEWSVKNAGDAMVLIGTPTYKDNAVQMKLERVKAEKIKQPQK